MAKASKAMSPTSAEVEAHILKVARKYPGLVNVRTVLNTAAGRPIYAVTITDGKTADEDKQHALIIAGQHGSEESGRLVALSLIDWLVSPAGLKTRKKQKIVVMPSVNPDGCELDIYGTPAGVLPNMDHAPGGAKTPEGQGVEIMARELQPEVFVDMHGKGGSGCGTDMVLWPWAKQYTEDEHLLHAMAEEMAVAAQKEGIPQVTHSLTWSGWDSAPTETSTTVYAYKTFKSAVMLTETCESNTHRYPPALRARSGLAKIRALLEWGNRRYGRLYYSGYPFMLVSEFFNMGLLAYGTTAAQRRASRVALWTNIAQFDKFGMETPEDAKVKKLIVEYSGPEIDEGFAMQLGVAGRRTVKSASFDGKPLGKSFTDGYYIFPGQGVTHVVGNIPSLKPGRHELVVKLS